MAATAISGMHPIDSSSVLPSPASPTTSFQGQQQLLSSRSHLNSNSIRGQSPPFPSTPAANGYGNILDAPVGITYREFVRTWSDTHVAFWLSDIKCGSQAPRFKENDIRGDVLLELDQVTLKEMGVASIGDRLRIVNAIKSLRQKCSKPLPVPIPTVDRGHSKSIDGRSSSASDNSGAISSRSGHERSASENSRLSSRRLDAGRPAPLQLNSSRANDLPRIVRDGAGPDSARSIPPVRPLPQPSQSAVGSSATPTSNNSSQSSSSVRSGLPYVPPVPRNQPPNPPPSRAPPRAPLNGSSLNGRRTPTQGDIPSYANQPLPPAPQNQNLLTPGTANSNWTGYGLPSDPRPGGKTSVRATSPLNLQPRGSRLNNNPTHGRKMSLSPPNSTSAPPKLGPRPSTGTNSHPYAAAQGAGLLSAAAQQAYNLSPIAESFISTSGSPSPPTLAYAASRGSSNRPNTPSHSNILSLDDLRRKLVKFLLPDERHSCTINVADCAGGVEVLEKVLKKMGKTGSLGADADGSAGHIQLSEGGLIVDGWGVFLDLPNSERADEPLTETELINICQTPPDHPWREHGLTVRRAGKAKRTKALAQIFGEVPPPPGQRNSPTTPDAGSTGYNKFTGGLLGKSTKRASSVSVLSGLGVRDPEKALDPVSPTTPNLKSPSSPVTKKPSKLRNFFGQRPPSELITTHLTEYFPFTEKKVLERTARNSLMRSGTRDSTLSNSQPLPSRFSSSTQGSPPRLSVSSTRTSMSSDPPAVPDKPISPPDSAGSTGPIPRVSLSTQDGQSVDLNAPSPNETESSVPDSSQSPPSTAESPPGARRVSTASSGSKRLSFITELRSKRDRSDTASLMTVDQITAEVESRRESLEVDRETDDWTKVDTEDGEDLESTLAEDEVPNEVFDEEEETLTENDEEEEAETAETSTTSFKWIKGALIGAGSFGKVYLGMDAANGLLMAVKQVELPKGSAINQERKKNMLKALEREIEFLKDLQHENIVQYLYSSLDDDFLNIFLEYVPGGSVSALLRNYGAFEETLVRNFVRQILEGLNYLHERDIIHRDIKGANILVDNKGGIKISDFGLSKKVEDSLLHRMHRPSLQGSVFWMAPEVVKQTGHTRKADIWSVGCLVVEMLTGEHPWAQLTQMQAIFKIGSSAKPAIPSDISTEAQEFLDRTFEINHDDRPDAGELLQHPWMVKKPHSHKNHPAKGNTATVTVTEVAAS